MISRSHPGPSPAASLATRPRTRHPTNCRRTLARSGGDERALHAIREVPVMARCHRGGRVRSIAPTDGIKGFTVSKGRPHVHVAGPLSSVHVVGWPAPLVFLVGLLLARVFKHYRFGSIIDEEAGRKPEPSQQQVAQQGRRPPRVPVMVLRMDRGGPRSSGEPRRRPHSTTRSKRPLHHDV